MTTRAEELSLRMTGECHSVCRGVRILTGAIALVVSFGVAVAQAPAISSVNVAPSDSSADVSWTTDQPASSRVDYALDGCTVGCAGATEAYFLAYEFDELSGLQAVDATGFGNDGTFENGATRNATGHRGRAAEFNGVAGNVDLGGLDLGGSAVTFALWFRADDFDVADARLLSKAVDATESNHYWMLATEGTELRFRLKSTTTGTTTLTSSGAGLVAGVWTHVAATYDGVQMRLYKDGVLVGSTPKTGAVSANPTVEAWIGDNPGGGKTFDGLIDEVRIWERVLPAAEIGLIRNQRFYGWHVEDQALTTAHAVTLLGLSPSSTYHYAVTSTNGAAQTSTTADATFVTDAFSGAPLASDDFHTCTLDTGRWTFFNPLGDASYTIRDATTGDGHVEIYVPGGVSHDPWSANDAPRIMQPAPNSNFQIVAKFDSAISSAYQQQGVMVEESANRWLRFDFVHTGGSVIAFAASFTGGVPTPTINRSIFGAGPSPVPLFVRVTRSGDQWTHEHSTNGTTWIANGTFSSALTVTSAGLFGANFASGGNAPAHTASADYFFNSAAPIAVEDGDPPGPGRALTVNVAGSGSVLRDPDQALYYCAPDVTLTAEPAPGFEFSGWSGALAGSANPTMLTMHGDRTVTASFAAAPGAPVISDVVVEPHEDRAEVRWTTNEPATSRVEFGTTAGYGSVTESLTLVTQHAVTLTGLVPATLYHFRVLSVDSSSQSAATADATFQTIPAVAVSDDFNRCDLAGSPWTFVDPLGDASYELHGGGTSDASVSIVVPGDVSHDPWTSNDAPRLMQPALDEDFQLEVKIESPISLRHQQHGIIVEQDADDWLRFDFVADGSSVRAFSASITAGAPQIRINQTISTVPSAAPMWLRVTRTGDVWRLEHSTNGASWTLAGTYVRTLEVTAVGLFAGNQGSNSDAPPYTAVFDYFFNTDAPIAPEDGGTPGTAASLTVDVTGSGQVVRTPDRPAYYCGEEVDLDAVPAPGFTFTGWSGDLAGTTTPQTLAMTSNRTVGATFTAAPGPPEISDFAIDVDATSATFSWRTNEPATTRVDYGLAPFFDSSAENLALLVEHSITITGLTPATTYFYQVSSTDSSAQSASTVTDTFATTPNDFQSDDFNVHHLRTDLWTWVDPVGDSAYSLAGAGTGDAQISIHVAAGVPHDPWATGNGAPRLMQPANDDDLQAETKITSVMSKGNQQHGILVEEDAGHWIRFDFVHDGSKSFAFAAVIEGGVATVKVSRNIQLGPSPAPIWLRVLRAGDVWTHQYSLNGAQWTTAGSFMHVMNVTQIGVFAGNFGYDDNAPAYTGTFDYFFNNDDPIAPEDGGTPPADTTDPTIQAIDTSSGKTYFRVSWITDEPTTGRVDFGETAAYELGNQVSSTLGVVHTVEVSDLTTDRDYHFRIVAQDDSGNESQTGDLVVRVEGIRFTFWYGPSQPMGQIGRPQVWAAILGNVTDLDGVDTLTFALNGGPERDLSMGPDERRLASLGDFVAEVDWAELVEGSNEFRFTAEDAIGNVEQATATLVYDSGNTWPESYTIDWSQVANIQDVAQVVDGHWTLSAAGVRPAVLEYDRLIGIGETSWTDYEVVVPITVHSIDIPGSATPTSGGPAVGVVLRWNGHTQWNDDQPRWGYWPLGAIAWHIWLPSFTGFQILGNENKLVKNEAGGRTLQIGMTYIFKSQVTTVAGTGAARYRQKVWVQGAPEPLNWDIQGELSAANGPESGSMMLLAHHTDATFGNVTITSLAPCDGIPRTLTTNIVGGGSVSRDPDAATYACEERVTLTAVPAPGSEFTGWSGDLAGSANPQSVLMTANRTVTASFQVAPGPPVISNVAVDAGDTWATVTWRTNEPATSRVNWGLASTAENAAARTPLVTSHSVTLTGLAPGTTYLFNVQSVDSASLSSTSTQSSFTTDPPMAAAFESDDFNACALDPRWTFVNPLGDASFSIVGAGAGNAHLHIAVPAGPLSHNAWSTNDAPRVMQTAANTDFEIETRFLSGLGLRYQQQGLIIEQDADDYIRVDFYSDGSQLRAFAATITAGVPTSRLSTVLTAGLPEYLRVTRYGNLWTVSHSHDGTNWFTPGNFTHALTVTATGVWAGNVRDGAPSAPAHTAIVDYVFETSAHVSPEDGGVLPGGLALATATSGDGAMVADPDQNEFFCGETVILTAVPDPGWVFEGWGGDLAGVANPETLAMTAPHSVSADFVADTEPPVIGSVEVEVGDTYATVTWLTNEPATSRVDWGLTAAYGEFIESTSLVIEHSIALGGLTPETTYHFQITSQDAIAAASSTLDATFTTTPIAPGPFESDDFNTCALDPRWTFVNPLGDASFAVLGVGSGNARFRIDVPAGVSHDPWTSPNAPRIMQPALNTDLQIVAKFDSLVSLQYQEQGIFVEQDAARWLRFDFHSDGTEVRTFASTHVSGVATGRVFLALGPAFQGVPLHMRVTRGGSLWTLEYSSDGASWLVAGSFTHAMTVNAVGVFAGNASFGGSAPAHTMLVDYFLEGTVPPASEDIGNPGNGKRLTLLKTGSGSVNRSPNQSFYYCSESVTVTATPAAGWVFSGWTGALSGFANPASVIVNVDKTVTANFVADSSPPVIGDIQVVPGETSATVTWITNEPATSVVDYGPTVSYGQNVTDLTLVTNHSVLLTGLTADMTYHFRVTSADSLGASSSSADQQFDTLPPPAGPFASDDFHSAVLAPVWTFIDPLGDATLTLTGAGTADAQARIAVPGGVSHDPWAVNDAPRLMQAADDVDFRLEVKLESTVTQGYQSQGIIVEQDIDDWLRFDTYATGTSGWAFASSVSGGVPSARINTNIVAGPTPVPLWLRITRTGNLWTYEYSTDGSAWATAGSFSRAMTVTAVGVFAGNFDGGSGVPAHTAIFDYVFDADAPIVPEDGVAPPGPGSYSTPYDQPLPPPPAPPADGPTGIAPPDPRLDDPDARPYALPQRHELAPEPE